MKPEVKRITERNIIYDYLKKLFTRGQVFLKTKEHNIETSSFIFNEDGIAFTLSQSVSIPDEGISLYIRNGNELIIIRVVITGRAGEEYKCSVSDMFIMNIPRREERVNAAVNNDIGRAYVSNIISDFTLKESFENNRRTILALKENFEEKLGKQYDSAKIYSIIDQKRDERMKYFMEERMPYFIRDVTQPAEDDPQYRYYIANIYSAQQEADKRMISEIAVPFLYRHMMPFGYLCVNGMQPLSNEDFSLLKKYGMGISTVVTNDTNMIRSSDDRAAITDLSRNGLGIIFKERVLLKHFMEEGLVIFTVFLPGDKTLIIMCQVKNITFLKKGIYRIGCRIVNFDATGEVSYSEYLESAGINTNPDAEQQLSGS